MNDGDIDKLQIDPDRLGQWGGRESDENKSR